MKYLVTLALVFATGCGKVGKRVDLQGYYASTLGPELSIRTTEVGCVTQGVDVGPDSMQFIENIYQDKDCTGPVIGVIKTTGSYTIGDEIDKGTHLTALDYQIDRVFIKPLSKNWIKIMGIDTTGPCNLSKIPINADYDVTGLDCGLWGQFPAHNTVFFTSYILNDKDFTFTKLPRESPKHIGTREHPAPRDTELVLTYRQK
jgi:hypothetical protein